MEDLVGARIFMSVILLALAYSAAWAAVLLPKIYGYMRESVNCN
jgi:hypothetical protein